MEKVNYAWDQGSRQPVPVLGAQPSFNITHSKSTYESFPFHETELNFHEGPGCGVAARLLPVGCAEQARGWR